MLTLCSDMQPCKIPTFMWSLTVLRLFLCRGGEQVSPANSLGLRGWTQIYESSSCLASASCAWSHVAATIMAKVKAWHLQGKDEEEPLVQLDDQQLEQAQCHVVKVLGENDFKLSKIDVVSKSMARAVAVISQYQKENLRKFTKVEDASLLSSGPRWHMVVYACKVSTKTVWDQKPSTKRTKSYILPRGSLLSHKTAVY